MEREADYMPGSWARWIQGGSAPDLKLPDFTRSALPWYFVMATLEYVVSEFQRKKVYYRRQTMSNLLSGLIGFVLTGIFVRGLNVFPFLVLYHFVGRKVAPWTAESYTDPWVNLMGFLGFDLAFYWYHRISHMTNLGWAGHYVHHQSRDFNIITAMRQGITEPLITCWFYMPLGLVVSPDVYFWHRTVNLVYQFFLHTRLIGKLGPLEWFLNTPSHHRVHHARNYGRANYGGILIIWDRIFGSFEAERDDLECVYGLDALRISMDTYNPMWHQGQHWIETVKLMFTINPIKALFTRAFSKDMVSPLVTDAMKDEKGKITIKPSEGPIDQRPLCWIDIYVAIQALAIGGPCALAVAAYAHTMEPLTLILAVLNCGAAFTTGGMMMDETLRGLHAEWIRLAVLPLFAFVYLPLAWALQTVGYCLVSIAAAYLAHHNNHRSLPLSHILQKSAMKMVKKAA
ncbi:unnamed protein product [Ostreobium quekettii]|uniref:Fatty acid hydroxylase domain-containing protein n=1 Tax=Ostreobium quekettii TaxID=121088 RepID=A0A8S1IT75_9CHLO|nr:unnamed protein product [Ostreobium quekettii]